MSRLPLAVLVWLAAAPAVVLAAEAPVFAAISAVAETAAVEVDPDDPAIWVHLTEPENSLVLGTDKQVGLNVFGLDGRIVAKLPDGRLNNIDLRQDIALGGATLTLAAATRRDDDTIVFYEIDAAGHLTHATPFAFPGAPRAMSDDIYGLGLYYAPAAQRLFVVVNFKTGDVFQWEVTRNDGALALNLKREWRVPSQPEGIVADDQLGYIYVGEEDGGIWRFPADPEAEPAATLVDAIGSACLPVDDVEGMAIAKQPGDGGYLVVSAQGVNRYALYPRRPAGDGTQACLGSVEVATGATDPVSETDGLDVATDLVTASFPNGLMVVQDDRNENFTRNFKLISWGAVTKALGLP